MNKVSLSIGGHDVESKKKGERVNPVSACVRCREVYVSSYGTGCGCSTVYDHWMDVEAVQSNARIYKPNS